MIFKQLALTVALIVLNFSSEVFSDAQCDVSNSIIKYEKDKSYTYEFSFVTTIKNYFYNEGRKVLIKGEAVLTVITPCEFLLTLQKQSIENQDGQSPSSTEKIESTAVRFTSKNGVVDQFYISDAEESWTVNIKRAVVSMLQNKAFSGEMTATSSMETSISGSCPILHFKNENKYIKTTHLNKCTQREGGYKINMGIPYEVSPESTSNVIPVLNSTSFCEQQTSEDLIQSVSCSESHENNGFPHTDTEIKSTLKLITTEGKKYSDDQLAASIKRTSFLSTILFDQQKSKISLTEKKKNNLAMEGKRILSLLDSPRNQAEVFLQLKNILGEMEELTELFESKDPILTEKSKKLYMDAAAEIITNPAVIFLTKLISTGSNVDDTTKMLFYHHLSYAVEPKEDGFASLNTMIGQAINSEANEKHYQSLNQRLLLGASGYAYHFCTGLIQSCSTSQAYTQFLELLTGYVKLDPKLNEHLVIAALEALGNINQLSSGSVDAIKLILDGTSENWLKALALDAFRRDPCQKQLKDKVRTMFEDKSQSEDIRIQSYLATTKCLNQEDIDAVQKVFADSNSNSVSRFIASHVRNIMDSSSPSKRQLKNSISQIKLPETAPTSTPQTSKYIEYSHFNPADNMGFSIEATLLYATDASAFSLPIFASFNLTLDLAGRSYNILELGLSGRNLIDSDTSAVIDFEDSVNWFAILDSLYADDSYNRVLGTTAAMGSSCHESMKHIFLKTLAGVKASDSKTEINIVQPFSFLDDELIYPTISGLPLHISVHGTAVHSLKVILGENFNFHQIMESFGEILHIKSNILSSSSIAFTSRISIGIPRASLLETGVQTEFSVDKTCAFGLDVNSDSGIFDIKINLPEEKIATISFNLTGYIFEELDGIFEKKPYTMAMVRMIQNPFLQCIKDPTNLSGLKICTMDHSPLSTMERAHHMTITVEKHDTSMEGYYFQYLYDSESPMNENRQLTLDTPGSAVNRKIVLSSVLKYSPDSSTFTALFTVQSPWTNVKLDALSSNPREDRIFAEIRGNIDGEEYYINLNATTEVGRYNEVLPLLCIDPMYICNSEFEASIEFSSSQTRGEIIQLMGAILEQNNNESSLTLQFDGPAKYILGDATVSVYYDKNINDLEGVVVMGFNFSLLSGAAGVVGLELDYMDDHSAESMKQSYSSQLEFAGTQYAFSNIIQGSEVLMSTRDGDTDNGSGKMTMQNIFESNSTYSITPGHWCEVTTQVFTNYSDDGVTYQNLVMTTESDQLQGPIIFFADIMVTPSLFNGNMQLDYIENHVDISADSKSETLDTNMKFKAFIKDNAELDGNATFNINKRVEVYFNTKCLKTEFEMHHHCQQYLEGDQIIGKAETTWNNPRYPAQSGKLRTDSSINLILQTLNSTTVQTGQGGSTEVIIYGLLTKNPENGESLLDVSYKDIDDRTFRSCMRQKMELGTESLSSNISWKIEQPNSAEPLLELLWLINYDWMNHNPDLDAFSLNMTESLDFSQDHRYIFGIPIGTKQFHSGYNIFFLENKAGDSRSLSGQLYQTDYTAPAIDLMGHIKLLGDNLDRSGNVEINGSITHPSTRDNILIGMHYIVAPEETTVQTYTNFIASTTDLSSLETTVHAEGSCNSSMYFKDEHDFKLTKTGRYIIGNRTISWDELVKCYGNEFEFELDMTDGNGAVFVYVYKMKLHEENDQTKLKVHSRSNLDYKATNFNVTLTRK